MMRRVDDILLFSLVSSTRLYLLTSHDVSMIYYLFSLVSSTRLYLLTCCLVDL